MDLAPTYNAGNEQRNNDGNQKRYQQRDCYYLSIHGATFQYKSIFYKTLLVNIQQIYIHKY
jgi:hypothetical protein